MPPLFRILWALTKTPKGSLLHQCRAALLNILSHFPTKSGGRSPRNPGPCMSPTMRCVSGSFVISRAFVICTYQHQHPGITSSTNDRPCSRSCQRPLQLLRVRPAARFQLSLLRSRSPSREFCRPFAHRATEGSALLPQKSKRKTLLYDIMLRTTLKRRSW